MSNNSTSPAPKDSCGCCCNKDEVATNSSGVTKESGTGAYPGLQGVAPNNGYNLAQIGDLKSYSNASDETGQNHDTTYPSVQGAALPHETNTNPSQQGCLPHEGPEGQ